MCLMREGRSACSAISLSNLPFGGAGKGATARPFAIPAFDPCPGQPGPLVVVLGPSSTAHPWTGDDLGRLPAAYPRHASRQPARPRVAKAALVSRPSPLLV